MPCSQDLQLSQTLIRLKNHEFSLVVQELRRGAAARWREWWMEDDELAKPVTDHHYLSSSCGYPMRDCWQSRPAQNPEELWKGNLSHPLHTKEKHVGLLMFCLGLWFVFGFFFGLEAFGWTTQSILVFIIKNGRQDSENQWCEEIIMIIIQIGYFVIIWNYLYLERRSYFSREL